MPAPKSASSPDPTAAPPAPTLTPGAEKTPQAILDRIKSVK